MGAGGGAADAGRRLLRAVPRVPVPIDVLFVRTGEMNARWVVVVPLAAFGHERVGVPLRNLLAILVLRNKAVRVKAVPAIPNRAIVLPVHVG